MLVCQNVILALLSVIEDTSDHGDVVDGVDVGLLMGLQAYELWFLGRRNYKSILVHVWLEKVGLAVNFVLKLYDGYDFFSVYVYSEDLVILGKQNTIWIRTIWLFLEMKVHTNFCKELYILQQYPSTLLKLSTITTFFCFVHKKLVGFLFVHYQYLARDDG